MIRVGIIGMGGMGWFHAARYSQIPGVQLVAIADVRTDRVEAKKAVQINIENQAGLPDFSTAQRFKDGNHLIAEANVDMIDICLPSFLHAEYTIRALQSGRHVLCEKPMALSINDADAMISAAKAAKRKLMIAQVIRFWPEYQFLKRTIQQGSLGRLLSLNLSRLGSRPSTWGWEDWFLNPARSGGALYDLHIHDVDFVNTLFGAPDLIQASGRRISPGAPCEVIHALYGYSAGPQISIYSGWSEVQIPFRAGFEAWFERGFVRLDPGKTQALTICDDANQINDHPADYLPGDAYLNEIQYFVDCVQNDHEPVECPPESARDSLVLLERERVIIDREVQS